ncbi:MAG: hemerythrin domain-containing protein [Elusimicrobia bacterium]|nr:hemerythrin domain-containing protein [Elusimicrobiota bacterium]
MSLPLVAFLRRQHGVFRGLLDEMESALKTPAGEAQAADALRRLLPQLSAHERVERELLYPAIIAHVKPVDPRVIDMFEEAHERVHEKVDSLRAALQDRNAALGRLVAAADFIALLREHLEEEEETLFPLAESSVPGETLRELGERAEKAAGAPGHAGRKR